MMETSSSVDRKTLSRSLLQPDGAKVVVLESLSVTSATELDRALDSSRRPGGLILMVAKLDGNARTIERLLVGAGFRVAWLMEQPEALRWLDSFRPDLILAEATICRDDGFQFCRAASMQSDSAVVVVADEPNDVDCVMALERGAADYIGSNGAPVVIVARIRSAIRSTTHHERSAFRRRLIVDPIARAVSYEGKRVRLANAEFEILLKLFKNANKVVTVGTLLHQSEVTNPASSRALSMRIYRIRCRFHEVGAPRSLLKAVRREGYSFDASLLTNPRDLLIAESRHLMEQESQDVARRSV